MPGKKRGAKNLFARYRLKARFILLSFFLYALAGGAQRLSLSVQTSSGDRIASSIAPSKNKPAELQFSREYQPGDKIVVSGAPEWLTLQVGDAVAPCSVYLAPAARGRFEFAIPFGTGEQHTGSAYAPDAFTGPAHILSVLPLTRKERGARRNLASNSCDQRTDTPTAFPHASTNSVSRMAYNFEARNAIDGVTRNGHHGEWPYESWGPLIADDLWWKLDFGREVELDTVRLMLRTDFPHDSYWRSAVIEFSDGDPLPIQLTNSSEFQDFHFSTRHTTWCKLTHLVSADPRWSALVEVEAWGRDSH